MTFHRRAPGLRALLTALAFSVLALPLALGLLAHSLLLGNLNEATQVRFSSVNRELGLALETGPEGELRVRKGYLPPLWLSLAVADAGNRILWTNFPGVSPGEAMDRAYAAASSGQASAFSYYSDVVEKAGRVVGSYVARIPSRDLRLIEGRKNLRGSFLILCSIALFSVLAGGGVSAIIASSALRLEKAARAIASGDLDTPVQARGLREIQSLAEAMDDMRSSLAESRDARNRFLAAISHDLRTPLTSIAGYLEAIEDGLASDPEVLSRYLAILGSKTRILEERIAGLLEFARMETREWRMGFEPLELGIFLGQLVHEAGEDASLVGRRLLSDIGAAEGIEVNADPVLLRRAFENILSNAIRYSPEGSSIRLAARREMSSLVVCIDDEGPGIPPSDRSRVFEPFYRGSGAREGEGNGLGLFIALSVIEGHGWSLAAEASPAGGARFSIAIPAGLAT